MIRIDGTTITMTRGDTLSLTIGVKQGEEDYQVQEGDVIRFAMKRSYSDAEPLIVKQIGTDDLALQLDPEDTKDLPFGSYVYDIEITMEDGTVDTFIAEAKIVLAKEVY